LYKMKKYDEILKYAAKAPEYVKKERFFWENYLLSAQKKGLDLKPIYFESFKYTDSLKNSFYWYLINKKDKEISKYLKEIKDPEILYSAYMILGKYNKAYEILKQNPKNDVNYLLQELYLTSILYKNANKKEFYIFRRLDKYINKNPELLKQKDIFDAYFTLSLKYSYAKKIERLLQFAKKNFSDYDKYYRLYHLKYKNYENLMYMERK